MQTRYVFMMLGFLGAGKSYVSGWLTPHVGAVYLRADALRLAMFGEDRPELYLPENKALVNNANRYAMNQILNSGQAHVLLDANHNNRQVRRSIASEANKQGAVAIVVWVKTSLDIAKKRTVVREGIEGHKLFEPNLVEKMAKMLEEPQQEELVIVINGEATAEDQQRSFDEQFLTIKASIESGTKERIQENQSK